MSDNHIFRTTGLEISLRNSSRYYNLNGIFKTLTIIQIYCGNHFFFQENVITFLMFFVKSGYILNIVNTFKWK